MEQWSDRHTMISNSDKEYWAARSKTRYSIEHYSRKFEAKRLIKLFNSWFNLDGVMILDAGCGWGYWLAILGKRANIIGIDLSLEMLNSAKIILREHMKNVTLIRADIMNMPFPDQTFDLVISLGVIEHFPDTLTALKSELNVLKHRKFLFFSVPNIFDFPNRIIRFITKSKSKKSYYQKYFTTSKIAKIVKKSNSRVYAINGYGDIIPPTIMKHLFKSRGILSVIQRFLTRVLYYYQKVILEENPFLNAILSHMILLKCVRL